MATGAMAPAGNVLHPTDTKLHGSIDKSASVSKDTDYARRPSESAAFNDSFDDFCGDIFAMSFEREMPPSRGSPAADRPPLDPLAAPSPSKDRFQSTKPQRPMMQAARSPARATPMSITPPPPRRRNFDPLEQSFLGGLMGTPRI